MFKPILASLITFPFLLSCSALDQMKSTATSAAKGIRYFSPSDLRPATIRVVEARPKDLQEMPLGKDRALAFERERKQSFWSFMSGSFKEPVLPTMESVEADGSLLPPKHL